VITAHVNNNITAATGDNSIISSAANNILTAHVNNTITATGGNNSIIATAGSNSMTANAASQSNTISATGVSGVNYLTANATTGANNIEAKTNNVGFATSGSINNIGNTNTSVNTMRGVNTTIISYNGGVLPDNSIVVRETQNTVVGLNAFDFGTQVNGGMYIDGSLGVNGNIYSLNPTANATINVANNGMVIEGATNAVSLVSDTDALLTNARTELDLQPASASLLVNTDSGNSHGVAIDQTQTRLSGGTHSTSMTLDDSGATFRNDATGGAARVTGVADGYSDFDAVNFRQLRTAYSGIASAAALAAIPDPTPGKNFTMGVGYGNFQKQDAVAVGIKAILPDKNISFTGGMGWVDTTYTTSVGFGYSF